MKALRYIIASLAAASLFASCVKEDEVTKGRPEAEGCYGVYFPSQKIATEYDPSDPTSFQLIIRRTVSDGDITVPVIVSDTAKIFHIPEITFEDGQLEDTVTVTFDDAVVGVEYGATISVEDPQYVSIYGTNQTDISFQIVRAKWKKLGKGLFREVFVDDWYGNGTNEYEVEIEENENKPGIYRLVDIYGAAYPGYQYFIDTYGVTVDDMCDTETRNYIVVNAQDPNFVYIPLQVTGFDWGDLTIADMAGFYISRGNDPKQVAEAGYGGTLVEGVITFKPSQLITNLASYNGSYYTCDPLGLTRIVLPGFKPFDYSLGVLAGESEAGVVPVEFSLGANIDTVKYAIVPGELDAVGAEEYINAVVSGTVATDTVTVSRSQGITLEATGIYTLVAVGFRDGVKKAATFVSFGYVANGEERPVTISAGLENTNKYSGLGEAFGSDNLLEYYVYGSDLTDVKIGLYSYINYASDADGCVEDLLESDSVEKEDLAEINGGIFTGVFKALAPGTRYILLIWATNGYESKVITADATTTGDPLPVYMTYGESDYDDEQAPADETGLYGTYNLYAVDAFGSLGLREYLGQSVIADDDLVPNEGPDDSGLYDEYVQISGLGGPNLASVNPSVTFDYYDGVLYCSGAKSRVDSLFSIYSVDYASVKAGNNNGIQSGSGYWGYFIPVAEGYWAYLGSNNAITRYGLNFNGIGFYYNGAFYALYQDYLLVDPEVDDNGLAPEPETPATSSAKLDFYKNFEINIKVIEAKKHAFDRVHAAKRIVNYADHANNNYGSAPLRTTDWEVVDATMPTRNGRVSDKAFKVKGNR